MPRRIFLGAAVATLAVLLYLHFEPSEPAASHPTGTASGTARPAAPVQPASPRAPRAEDAGAPVASPAEGELEDAPGTLSLRGIVTDEGGQPIAGVNVRAEPALYAETTARASGKTDLQGRFRLRSLIPGTYKLRFWRERFLIRDFDAYELTASPPPLAVTLQGAPTVQGKIVDGQGKPLSGVPVRITDSRQVIAALVASGEWQPEFATPDQEFAGDWMKTQTSLDGSFILDTPKPGPWLVRARREGFALAELEISSPAKNVVLVMGAGAPVELSVVDEKELPVPQAYVGVWLETDELALTLQATTDAQGHAVLQGLSPGQYQLMAVPPQEQGLRMVTAPLTVRTDKPQRVTLKFEPGHTLSGIVVDSSGKPVPDTDVTVRLMESPELSADKLVQPVWKRLSLEQRRAPLSTRTGPDGHFTLPHLLRLDYFIYVKKPGYTLAEPSGLRDSPRAPVPLASPADGELRIVLDSKGRLSGRVVRASDGEPLTSFDLDGRNYTSPDGTFTVTAGEPGHHVLEILAPGVGGLRQEYAALGEDVNLGDLVLGDGRPLRVQVVDSETGRPLEGALLRLLDKTRAPGSPAEAGFLYRLELGMKGLPQTGQDGSCLIPDAPAHPLVLSAELKGYQKAEVELGPHEQELTVRLRPWATLQGHVFLGGEPLEDGMVNIYTAAGAHAGQLKVRQGWYSGHRVAPGRYMLRADCTGCPRPKPIYLAQEVTVPGPLETLSVDLHDSGGATLEVHTSLMLDRLMLVPGTRSVLPQLDQLKALELRRLPGERLEEEGGYLFRGVPAGQYTLVGYSEQENSTRSFLYQEVAVPAEGVLKLQFQPD